MIVRDERGRDEFVCHQVQMVVARKPHACDNCREEIQKGEAYERMLVWCGRHEIVRNCALCAWDDEFRPGPFAYAAERASLAGQE
jgi:hypothetical protein